MAPGTKCIHYSSVAKVLTIVGQAILRRPAHAFAHRCQDIS
jgi:hypothetical protein